MKTGQLAPTYRPIAHNIKLYDGPSQLTGDRIFVIATAANSNRKIGKMLQLWIIPAESPIDAVRSGRDAAVCGDCKLRGRNGTERVCYVEWWRSVSNIWQGHTRAERMDPWQFARVAEGLQLRIGAYGDPVAVPHDVWSPMLASAAGWTAYSHQWKRPAAHVYRWWCMASVDSEEERVAATKLGWRTFRVRGAGEPVGEREVVCPHEDDASVQCADCSLCRGVIRPAKSIVVTVHGRGGVKWFGSARPERLSA